MGINHTIDRLVFQTALDKSGMTQAELARSLNEDDGNLSRWLKSGYPAPKIRQLARALNIRGDEFKRLIGAPVFRTFFRKKFKGQPSENCVQRALQISEFWFDWEEFPNEVARLPDLSNEKSVATVAEIIRGMFKIPDVGVNLDTLAAVLKNHGIRVVPLSFSFFGLKDDQDDSNNNECAVTVFDSVSKYVVLLDTDANSALLTFNLFHELAHVFRPSAPQSKAEETFCDDVASELMYPNKIVSETLEQNAKKSAIEKLKALYAKLGGSYFGLTVTLQKRKLLKNTETVRLWKIARANDKPAEDYRPDEKTFSSINEFYDRIDVIDPRSIPYLDLKYAAFEGRLSGRKLADYLGLDSHDGVLLVEEWQKSAEG